MLTMPAFKCTAERSFSGFRRLKTYLRTNMKQQLLNSAAIMNVYMKETKALSIAILIDDFVLNLCSKKRFLLNQAVT